MPAPHAEHAARWVTPAFNAPRSLLLSHRCSSFANSSIRESHANASPQPPCRVLRSLRPSLRGLTLCCACTHIGCGQGLTFAQRCIWRTYGLVQLAVDWSPATKWSPTLSWLQPLQGQKDRGSVQSAVPLLGEQPFRAACLVCHGACVYLACARAPVCLHRAAQTLLEITVLECQLSTWPGLAMRGHPSAVSLYMQLKPAAAVSGRRRACAILIGYRMVQHAPACDELGHR